MDTGTVCPGLDDVNGDGGDQSDLVVDDARRRFSAAVDSAAAVSVSVSDGRLFDVNHQQQAPNSEVAKPTLRPTRAVAVVAAC
jgi:hypothetical protein